MFRIRIVRGVGQNTKHAWFLAHGIRVLKSRSTYARLAWPTILVGQARKLTFDSLAPLFVYIVVSINKTWANHDFVLYLMNHALGLITWFHPLNFTNNPNMKLLLGFTWVMEVIWQLKGWFTLWTMKLDQGSVRELIGCWSCPETTSVYTKKTIAEGPWRSRSPKYNFRGLTNALTWSNKFCGERGKRGCPLGEGKGPWQRNDV
jgi:hypothetical protein